MAGYGTDTGVNTPQETGFGVSRTRAVGAGLSLGANRETINITHKVGNTIVSLYSSSATAAKGVLISPESITINNSGGAATAIIVKLNYWTAVSTKDANPKYLQFLVGANETISIPMSRVIISDDANVLYNGTELAQAAPAGGSNMHLAVTNGSDAQLIAEALDDSETDITVDDGDYFKVGDLIKIDTEIIEVTSVDTDVLTVRRGVHGSDAAAHDDDAPILFPFFNANHNFTAATGGYDVAQTDNDGKFKAMNFFGYGRGVDYTETGILAGSVAIKFYNGGYQELGLSGITSGTNTGLTAGSTYYFKITVDGGSQIEPSFTVDSSNTKFGGRNGVLSKIQDYFNTQYYTTGSNLFEKKVSVGIVNGDIRITSGSCLSTSSIALAAGTSGADTTTEIFAQAIGRFPILTKVEDAIAARLPENTETVIGTGQTITNPTAFMYDDGFGRLTGAGRGTIDYDTGAISFTAKPNTEFVVSARYGSALTGNTSTAYFNTIEDVSAISTNDKIETKVKMRVSGYALKSK